MNVGIYLFSSYPKIIFYIYEVVSEYLLYFIFQTRQWNEQYETYEF